MSAVYYLPLVAVISPTAVLQGIVVSKTGRYRMLVCLGPFTRDMTRYS